MRKKMQILHFTVESVNQYNSQTCTGGAFT